VRKVRKVHGDLRHFPPGGVAARINEA